MAKPPDSPGAPGLSGIKAERLVYYPHSPNPFVRQLSRMSAQAEVTLAVLLVALGVILDYETGFELSML
ncbi:MAG: hypothetical protein P8174_03665, partial [Gemmatimonadota bacterium]